MPNIILIVMNVYIKCGSNYTFLLYSNEVWGIVSWEYLYVLLTKIPKPFMNTNIMISIF